jgi:hypothetical protein
VKPDVPSVLIELAGLVARNAVPSPDDSERASNLGLTSALLAMVAQSWDTAGHNLVVENRALRRVLGVPTITEDDFRLHSLATENRRLRAELIALHELIEGRNDPREVAVWQELVASTERRLLVSGLS